MGTACLLKITPFSCSPPVIPMSLFLSSSPKLKFCCRAFWICFLATVSFAHFSLCSGNVAHDQYLLFSSSDNPVASGYSLHQQHSAMLFINDYLTPSLIKSQICMTIYCSQISTGISWELIKKRNLSKGLGPTESESILTDPQVIHKHITVWEALLQGVQLKEH